MLCPDCGFAMTAFDKECPRCRKIGRPKPQIVTGHTEANTETSALSPQTLPLKQSNKNPFIISLAGLVIILSIAFAFLFLQQQRQVALAKSDADKNARQISDFKRNGYSQCVDGDKEGCQYYMDKLRDKGQVDDAEFLKANLIAAQFLIGTHGLGRLPDFVQDPQELQSRAAVAASSGDDSASASFTLLSDMTRLSKFLERPIQTLKHNEPPQSLSSPAPPSGFTGQAPPPSPFGLSIRTKAGGGDGKIDVH